jgi:hypothetical protein
MILDQCHEELLRYHRDKLSPALLHDLSALRAHWVSLYPQIEPLVGPDPLSDASAGADERNGRGNDDTSSSSEEPPPPPPTERRSMTAAMLGNPAIVPKIVGEHLAWGWAGFAAAGSGSGKRFRNRLPGKVTTVGRHGPLRF